MRKYLNICNQQYLIGLFLLCNRLELVLDRRRIKNWKISQHSLEKRKKFQLTVIDKAALLRKQRQLQITDSYSWHWKLIKCFFTRHWKWKIVDFIPSDFPSKNTSISLSPTHHHLTKTRGTFKKPVKVPFRWN